MQIPRQRIVYVTREVAPLLAEHTPGTGGGVPVPGSGRGRERLSMRAGPSAGGVVTFSGTTLAGQAIEFTMTDANFQLIGAPPEVILRVRNPRRR